MHMRRGRQRNNQRFASWVRDQGWLKGESQQDVLTPWCHIEVLHGSQAATANLRELVVDRGLELVSRVHKVGGNSIHKKVGVCRLNQDKCDDVREEKHGAFVHLHLLLVGLYVVITLGSRGSACLESK